MPTSTSTRVMPSDASPRAILATHSEEGRSSSPRSKERATWNGVDGEARAVCPYQRGGGRRSLGRGSPSRTAVGKWVDRGLWYDGKEGRKRTWAGRRADGSACGR